MSLLDETTDLHNLANQILVLLDAEVEAVADQLPGLLAAFGSEVTGSNYKLAEELHTRLVRAHIYARAVSRQTLARLETLGDVESIPPTPISLTPYGLVERITGFSSYVSSLVQDIVAGVETQLLNDRATVNETQTPPDIDTFYDGNRFRGSFGDALLYRVTFKATPTDIADIASELSIWLDYGAPGVQLFKQTKPLILGYGVAEPVTFLVPIFVGTLYSQNGGRLMVQADGDIEISQTQYLINRLHKAV